MNGRENSYPPACQLVPHSFSGGRANFLAANIGVRVSFLQIPNVKQAIATPLAGGKVERPCQLFQVMLLSTLKA